MLTKKQDELVNVYLSQFEDETKNLYREIATFLCELGFYPKKAGASISFTNTIHKKQIAKMGTNIRKNQTPSPKFSMRFSSCKDYSQRFTKIINDTLVKVTASNRYRLARCLTGECSGCPGEPDAHIYKSVLPNGEHITSCGVYTIEIPRITADDIDEIKHLIKKEHDYLMKREINSAG